MKCANLCYTRTIKNLKKLVKDLRKNQTLPEQIFWHKIRARRFSNYKLRRQVQIGNYIVDFVCYEKNLIVELDGRDHLTDESLEYDKTRTVYLQSRGFRVLRYFNKDVFNNIDNVLLDLWNNLNK